MISRLSRWLSEWWDRHERVTDADRKLRDEWVLEKRKRDANRTFIPRIETDIGNPDPRPPAPHQPARRPRRMPGANLRQTPRHAGRPDHLEDH